MLFRMQRLNEVELKGKIIMSDESELGRRQL
jgi:hypothetical protein